MAPATAGAVLFVISSVASLPPNRAQGKSKVCGHLVGLGPLFFRPLLSFLLGGDRPTAHEFHWRLRDLQHGPDALSDLRRYGGQT
jgi:hypothetical protein